MILNFLGIVVLIICANVFLEQARYESAIYGRKNSSTFLYWVCLVGAVCLAALNFVK